ncbi:MAG: type II secretion system protein N, partial [Nevskiales bacterium]
MARGSFPGLLLVAVTAIAAAGATQYLWRQQAAPAPLAMPEQVPPAPEMEVPDAAEPAMLPPDMALTGVVLNSDESKSTAWIEHGGRPAQSYRLGERVNNDYELLAIRPSHVLLEKTGQTYQLELGRAPTGAAQDQH